MRKTNLILAALFCAVAMLTCSCDYANVETEADTAESVSMFVCVETTSSWKIVYHRETKVMYAVSDYLKNNGNFTLLVNPDGSPMLWEGE